MGGIKRINEFPEGSGNLTGDDIFLFMDDPSGSGVTKKISLSQINSAINHPQVHILNNASGTINTDTSLYSVFNITLADSGVLSAPSNPSDGQRCLWRIKRTDNQVLSLNNTFRIINSGTIDNTNNTITLLDSIYDMDASRWDTLLYSNKPATLPGIPTSVSGVAGTAEVSLLWTAPEFDGNSAITDYIIQYSDDNGDTWTTFNDGVSTDTTATVIDLLVGVPYVFRIAAVNEVGTGEYSDTSAPVTPISTIIVDYLVVAGGGGGGTGQSALCNGGGGGAGGFRTGTDLALSPGTTYTVTVGGGGAVDTIGNDSVFSTITATAGGYGGNNINKNGANGGSGGGGAAIDSSSIGGSGNTPSTSPSQGNSGGSCPSMVSPYRGGGGGGASAYGGISGDNGTGGNGTASSISGSSVTYAGGGGGGSNGSTAASGGSGGGGEGGVDGNSPGIAATANTGGGGGGGAADTGGSGGSGIVIIRASSTAASTTGSPTVTTDDGDTIYTFTSSGSITF